MRPRSEDVIVGCSAVGCYAVLRAGKFMCEEHVDRIPEANKTEMLFTFDEWKAGRGRRANYVAARIRAIVAVADVEGKTAAHSLHAILAKLDSGEWRFNA